MLQYPRFSLFGSLCFDRERKLSQYHHLLILGSSPFPTVQSTTSPLPLDRGDLLPNLIWVYTLPSIGWCIHFFVFCVLFPLVERYGEGVASCVVTMAITSTLMRGLKGAKDISQGHIPCLYDGTGSLKRL